MVTKPSVKLVKKIHPVSNLHYERLAWHANSVVCGVDEVGRGSLAGPVVASAVIFPVGVVIEGIKDSKLLSKIELISLAIKIKKCAWFGIGVLDNYLIDSCNIRQATLVAMSRSVTNLLTICPILPKKILVDAMPLASCFGSEMEFISAPKGECWSYSIAAASILAKVHRDALMEKYNQIFPNFYFDQHKGYGTKEHQMQLAALGKVLIHRDTFLKKINIRQEEVQGSLF
jgi:ribonuclease HII